MIKKFKVVRRRKRKSESHLLKSVKQSLRDAQKATKVPKPKKVQPKPADLFEQQLMDNFNLDFMDHGALVLKEYKFHPERRWRFDYAWVVERVAVEIMGGTWIGGRHITGFGFEKDSEKLNEAQILGWRVLYITSAMVRDGRGLEFLKRILSS